MRDHESVISGRLLLARRASLFDHEARDLLDIADVLFLDETRWLVSLGAKAPELPQVDLTVPIATLHGYAHLAYTAPAVKDDGTWGLEDDSWQPDGDEGGGW